MKHATLICFVCIAAGCGGNDFVASDLSIDRTNWDSLIVRVGFVHERAFGDPTPARPDSFEVRLFNAAFDTLFVGHDSLVIVPDARLGDRERVLVETCGFFGRRASCGQLGFETSRKRVTVQSEMEYPENGDYDLGKYRFSYDAQRLQFGADSIWETIALPSTVEKRLSVRVLGERGDPIELPLRTDRGRFKLTNLRNNADFRRNLLAQLLDADEATVRFELFSTAFAIESPIWVSDAVVEAKTPQTRELEAGFFVEEAGSQLLDLLRTFPVGPNVYLFMNSWEFDRDEERYLVDFSLSWQSSFLRSRWFELAATLDVREDGSEPTVRLVDGNERGTRRWEQRFDGREVQISRISPRPDDRSPRRGADDG